MVGGPSLVRAAAGAVALVLVALLAASALASPARHRTAAGSATALSGLESSVLGRINGFRARHHLVPVRVSARLTAAARQHSRQMAAAGYFAHESADGSAFWKRIERYYGSGSWAYWSVGENLLWASPDVTPERALELWLASPEHRRNLLTARWREIGVSAVHATAVPGAYHGLDVTIVTTDFGVRR